MYLHLRPRPMSRTDAPPYLPGASHLYGEEAKELALAPVGLARHRTKWPCDQVGPPGPPPAHPSCPLDPWGAGWGEISPSGLPVRAAAPPGCACSVLRDPDRAKPTRSAAPCVPPRRFLDICAPCVSLQKKMHALDEAGRGAQSVGKTFFT